MRTLTVHGQSAAVAEALVTADVHLALDVLRDLTTQVALDLEVLVDERADPGDLFIREVTDAGGGIDSVDSQICSAVVWPTPWM